MDQRMEAKRRTRKPASASKMWCSGSNQDTKRGPSSVGISRNRTNACILCASRRTAFAMASSRAMSGSVATRISAGSPWVSRHRTRYSRAKRSGSRWRMAVPDKSTKARGTVATGAERPGSRASSRHSDESPANGGGLSWLPDKSPMEGQAPSRFPHEVPAGD